MHMHLLKEFVKGILQVTGHLRKMLYARPMDFHCKCKTVCSSKQGMIIFFVVYLISAI